MVSITSGIVHFYFPLFVHLNSIIYNGGHSNDYIFFHMQKVDGTYISVLDHGRIVDSVHNGRVFYVMIMDLNSLQRHYGDRLELEEK